MVCYVQHGIHDNAIEENLAKFPLLIYALSALSSGKDIAWQEKSRT